MHYDRKLEITNISTNIYFVFVNKEELIFPYYAVINERGLKELLPETFWQSKKDDLLIELNKLSPESIDHCNIPLVDEIVNVYKNNNINITLRKVLEDALILYYDACQEKMIDYSFLKFWMISELIIKKAEKITDKTVTSRIIQVLKSSVRIPTEKFLGEEIHFLQQKRNDLVHEGQIDNISQYDRNMSKLIADCILRLFIEWIPHIKEINGFSFVLKNLRQSYDNLDQYSEILEKLKKPNEFIIKSVLNILKFHGEMELSTFRNNLRDEFEENNDMIIDKIEKGLLRADLISLNNRAIKPTKRMFLEYDKDFKKLIIRYPKNDILI